MIATWATTTQKVEATSIHDDQYTWFIWISKSSPGGKGPECFALWHCSIWCSEALHRYLFAIWKMQVKLPSRSVCQVVKVPSCQAPSLPRYYTTKLPSCQVVMLPSYQAAELLRVAHIVMALITTMFARGRSDLNYWSTSSVLLLLPKALPHAFWAVEV